MMKKIQDILGIKNFYSTSANNNSFHRRGLHTFPVVPVKIYTDADLQKKSIVKDNKEKAGVYRWTNKKNGNTYIGSAGNLAARFNQYYNLKTLSKGNMTINKALLKYGYSNFQLDILEYCEPENAVVREQHYLDLCTPEYNILKTAGSSLGYVHREDTLAKFKARRHSEETIKKISEGLKGENHPFHGKIHSEETLKKMSDALKGRTLSEETRKKMVESKGTSVKVTDTETGITTIHPSKRQVARELNTSLDTVRRYIVSSKLFKDRYLIENLIEN